MVPQAADQVQVDSLHIVILSRAIQQLCAHKNQMLLVSQDDLSVLTKIYWKNLTEKFEQNCLATKTEKKKNGIIPNAQKDRLLNAIFNRSTFVSPVFFLNF